MNKPPNSIVPASSDHRLLNGSLRAWWQLHYVKKDQNSKFLNAPIRVSVLLLLSLSGISMWQCLTHPELATKFIGITGPILIAVLVLLAFSVRKHQRIVVSAQVGESAIFFKSPMFSRNVRWDEIRDFYSIQDNDHVLECSDGEELILTSDLSNSEELFQTIFAKLPVKPLQYDLNVRVPDEFFGQVHLAVFAVVMSVLIGIFQSSIFTGHLTISTSQWLIPAIFIAVPITVLIFCKYKVARLVRFGNSSVQVRTQADSVSMGSARQTTIKPFGPNFLFLNGTSGFFIMPQGPKTSSRQQLLEHQRRISAS